MWITLCLPLLISAVLAATAPWAGRRLPPRTAAWLLAAAAVVAAGAWVTVLAMLGFTRVGQIPEVAEQGHWSPHVLAAGSPVDRPVTAACALAVVVCGVALVVASWRRVRVMVGAWRACRDLPTVGDLTVIEDPVPTAFALPGKPGRVVVSSGMLQALSVDERRALVAHERCHLRNRHHLFLLAFHLPAAVNPLLRPLTRAGAFALERWADEEAVATVADRKLVARAVARAAIATKRVPQPEMAAAGGPVPQRVQALLDPPTPRRRHLVVALVALMAVCCGSLALAAHDTERLFEAAMPHHHSTAGSH